MLRKILISFLFSLPTFAGLTDYMKDSISNVGSNLSLEYYSTQERGYLLGGSWHYRVPNITVYPFTITPPSIKAGCGGIDIIMGGFSYVQPEYLVQVLQNLIQAAPAVAFEIALDTFAPQVNDIVNRITALINLINQLNFQSCQALNGIKAYVESNILKAKESTASKEAAKSQASGGTEAFFSGIQSWINEFSTQWNNLVNSLKNQPVKSGTTSVSIDTNSLIESALTSTKIGDDTQIASLIRGILGDINPSQLIALCANQQAGGGYIPPTISNITEEYLMKWVNGQVDLTGMDANGNPVPISFTSIKEQILNDLNSLYNDMLTATKPDPAKYTYLVYSDVPIVTYLKLASALNNPDVATVLQDKLANLITLSVVYGTLKAVLKTEMSSLQSLVQAYKQQYAEADCVVDELTKSFENIRRNYKNFNVNLSQVYWKTKQNSIAELTEFYRNYKLLQTVVYSRVAEVLPGGGQ